MDVRALITALDDGGANTVAEVRNAAQALLEHAGTPFAELSPYKWKSATVENVTVPADGTQDLLDVEGSGFVRSIFIAAAGSLANTVDSTITITVDGEAIPSLVADLGTLFGVHYAVGETIHAKTPHVYGEFRDAASNELGGLFLLPIPFSESITITFTNADGSSTSNIWATVTYTTDESPPYRLKCSTDAPAIYGDHEDVASGATSTLLDLAAGNSGWIVHHGMVMKGVSNNTYLERDIEIQVDREATASYKSSGLEDWFGFSFYFQQGSEVSTPVSGVGDIDNANEEVCAMVDLLAQMGGIRFDDGVIVTLGTEAAVTSGHDQASVLLYYLDT